MERGPIGIIMNSDYTHELKIWPEFFASILNGTKTFEVRKNDRDFKIGDRILLREYEPDTNTYTGDNLLISITYVLHGDPVWGLALNMCIFAFDILQPSGKIQPDQWWLAQLDRYGNPTLKDGAHPEQKGAQKARYLYRSLNLDDPNVNYSIVKLEFYPPDASSEGVDHDAINILQRAMQHMVK